MKRLLAFMKTLQLRILLITALCWLLPTLILGGFLGGVFFSALREQTERALVSSAAHAEDNTVAELERVIKLAKSVTYDNLLEDMTAKYQAGEVRYQDYFRECRTYLDRKYFRERAFSFAMFYQIDQPTQYMATTATTATTDEVDIFMREAQAQLTELSKTLDTKCYFMSTGGKTYLVRNLYNRKLKLFGMLVIGIRPELVLSPLLDSGNWQGTIDVQLDDYQLLPSGEPLNFDSGEIGLGERQDELILNGRVSTRDYTLSYRAHVDKHLVYGQIDQFNRLMLLLLLLLLPIEALIMIFVQRRLTRPLNLLAMASGKIESGELGVTVDVRTTDEVGQLARCYNAMSLQIKQLIEKSFEEELILRDARIEALQSRINPHFLNNTLEMINWQARMEGSETISVMIEAMSTLVNAGLDRTNERVVPLSEELSVADAYFYFLEQRFGPRLVVERDVAPALLRVPVPRLAIQTLLENAVEHGIAPAGGGLIKLSAHSKADTLFIDVTNNGKRLTNEDLRHIDELLKEDASSAPDKLSERLGIRNINRRAKLIYGENAGLSLMQDERGDTLARLRLPITSLL